MSSQVSFAVLQRQGKNNAPSFATQQELVLDIVDATVGHVTGVHKVCVHRLRVDGLEAIHEHPAVQVTAEGRGVQGGGERRERDFSNGRPWPCSTLWT